MLQGALENLSICQDLAGFTAELTLAPIKAYLTGRLNNESIGYGFLSGGVTFCALLPMRSIPFKVICLVGMNNDNFPRDSRASGFDLIARHPRAGDRSRRFDDKYLFLETLVSARERLHISYVGRSSEDNSLIPPSVLVSELLDYLQQGYRLDRPDLVTDHRLQAFSPAYFSGDGKLFSYSRENLEAAVGQVSSGKSTPAAFISRGLDPPSDEWRRIDLDGLARFFRNPARFFLRDRLGLYLDPDLPHIEEREVFSLEHLDRFLMAKELVHDGISGRDMLEAKAIHQAAGRLPAGSMGDAVFDDLKSDAGELVERIEKLLKGGSLEALEVDINVAGFSICGRLSGVTPAGRVAFHPGKGSGASLLAAWIHHLVFASAATHDRRTGDLTSYLVCRDKTWSFRPPENGPGILAALLNCYWKGLVRPLPFFPESSLAYAEQAVLKASRPEVARKAALAKWGPQRYRNAFSECENPYVDLCFGVSAGRPAPLDEAFMRLAVEIYGPLLDRRLALD
jgi:exodeoxyribonuclease V gamma subunit